MSKGHSNNEPVTVRIARPKGRPFQLWYRDANGRKIRISTGGRDESEAERQRAELEAKLLLGIPTTNGHKLAGPHMAWEDFREEYTGVKAAVMRNDSSVHAESRTVPDAEWDSFVLPLVESEGRWLLTLWAMIALQTQTASQTERDAFKASSFEQARTQMRNIPQAISMYRLDHAGRVPSRSQC